MAAGLATLRDREGVAAGFNWFTGAQTLHHETEEETKP